MKGILKIIAVTVPTTIITMIATIALTGRYIDHATNAEYREHTNERGDHDDFAPIQKEGITK